MIRIISSKPVIFRPITDSGRLRFEKLQPGSNRHLWKGRVGADTWPRIGTVYLHCP